eukprot:12677220-Prorocentrum_lima.AAC.1
MARRWGRRHQLQRRYECMWKASTFNSPAMSCRGSQGQRSETQHHHVLVSVAGVFRTTHQWEPPTPAN